MLRVSLAPAPPTALTATTARRILQSITVQYQPSSDVARQLNLDTRTLGKITGKTCNFPPGLALRISVLPSNSE